MTPRGDARMLRVAEHGLKKNFWCISLKDKIIPHISIEQIQMSILQTRSPDTDGVLKLKQNKTKRSLSNYYLQLLLLWGTISYSSFTVHWLPNMWKCSYAGS